MIGKKLTIFTISNITARTVKRQGTVIDYDPQRGEYIVQPKGCNYLIHHPNFCDSDLVFEGWDIPIQTDAEASNGLRSNACLNLIGERAVIRDYIAHHMCNPFFNPDTRANIIHVDPNKSKDPEQQESFLFPELAILSVKKGEN